MQRKNCLKFNNLFPIHYTNIHIENTKDLNKSDKPYLRRVLYGTEFMLTTLSVRYIIVFALNLCKDRKHIIMSNSI